MLSSCRILLGDHFRSVDFNDHGLPLLEDSKHHRPGTFGCDADDVPFPCWLIEAVARLEKCLWLAVSCDGTITLAVSSASSSKGRQPNVRQGDEASSTDE